MMFHANPKIAFAVAKTMDGGHHSRPVRGVARFASLNGQDRRALQVKKAQRRRQGVYRFGIDGGSTKRRFGRPAGFNDQ